MPASPTIPLFDGAGKPRDSGNLAILAVMRRASSRAKAASLDNDLAFERSSRRCSE